MVTPGATSPTITLDRGLSAGAKMELPVYLIHTVYRTLPLHFGMVKSKSRPGLNAAGLVPAFNLTGV
jgi:hypothetical protein